MPETARELVSDLSEKNKKLIKPYECKDRFENMTYEQNLENSRKKLERLLNESKEEKNMYKKELECLHKEIREINIEIELLENYDKFFHDEDVWKLEPIKKISKKQSMESMDIINIIKQNKKKAEIKRNESVVINKKYLKEKLKVKENLLKKIEETYSSIKNYKFELTEIEEKLNIHYHKILKEGKDTRIEGLRWVIRSIWSLKTVVMTSYLPNFLDENSIRYLFESSKLDVERLEIRDKINKLKKSIARMDKQSVFKTLYRQQIIQEQRKTTLLPDLNLYSSQSYLFSIKPKKKKVVQSQSTGKLSRRSSLLNNNYEKEKVLSFSQIVKFIEENKNSTIIDQEVADILKEIRTLEEKEQELSKKSEDMKEKELQRINSEFLFNDYERRFNITQEEVISALIGEDWTPNMYNKLQREQKKLIKSTQVCRTFHLLDKKSSVSGNIINFKIDLE